MKKLLLLMIFFLNTLSYAYINLYPLKFEKDITNGAAQQFVLYNRTTKERKYRVYVEKVEGKRSMAEWVEVYPKSILLEALEEDVIKIFVKAPEGTPEGEYQANLVIKEVALPVIKQDKEERKKKARIMTMVKLRLKGKVNYE
ncbi:Uncharacterised protein [Fusobacterium necrogenes]|uniref:Pili assembly chaperone N-terminal domain-containing protein n=1 Tax=Fusobacterium necrogenes TaxID=858 RepID=A0A377GVM6_9FUSO|nr:hypothetical protein [Fusobacterium necrogenes]STO30664.1 Uncharacterised protein [Fusobacterium necrogenes]